MERASHTRTNHEPGGDRLRAGTSFGRFSEASRRAFPTLSLIEAGLGADEAERLLRLRRARLGAARAGARGA